MANIIVSVVNDFSEFPGLRHCTTSEKSGEEFYHAVLNNAFKESYERMETLTIDLDGVDAYAPSFIDEAIGNLVFDFSLKVVKNHLKVKSIDEPHWIEMIESETYKQWEERRIRGPVPKKTADHEPWYRLVNGSIILEKWLTPMSSSKK